MRRLDPLDRTREAGIPVTTVPRTLLDLADVVGEDRLRRAVREAFVRRRVDERRLRAAVERGNGRRGARRLAALLADGPTATRSELEDRFLELLRAHGLPRPGVNVRLGGLPRPVEADFLFADARLVVETDGARFHDNRIAREADAMRQAMLEAAGYRVLRVTWRQVTREPQQTARRVRAALGS
ncbi:MAG TPA: DUF559 domain-containing protein [Solirubrobacteraceae bacterium]|nr:DUF559 domain-containing protein [Solirubrobacteraceae bacterium]